VKPPAVPESRRDRGASAGRLGRRAAKPANEVITDFGAEKTAIAAISAPNCNPKTNPENPSTKEKATSKPANEVITDAEVITDLKPIQRDEVGPSSPLPSPRVSACTAYREAIELELGRGRNAMAIWQDLVDQYGFASSYQSVQRFVRKLRGRQTPEARVVIVTAPGQEAQVDYGAGPMVRDPETRKYRRTRLFVMTLGCSRKAVRLLTFRSSARTWAELHERAFRRLGGTTRIVVLDNLLARACSSPTSTIPRSILSTATCWRTTARSQCRVVSRIQIAKARSSPA
jgi:hypothetical protein